MNGGEDYLRKKKSIIIKVIRRKMKYIVKLPICNFRKKIKISAINNE